MDQQNIILSLIERGWYAGDQFLPLTICQDLESELYTLPLMASQIGKGVNKLHNPLIRTDKLFWLDESNNSDAQNLYLEQINELMKLLNNELFLGLKQFEGHFSRYDQDGFYKKHLDQFVGNNERRVSIITYLNTPTSGGELRIYSKDNPDNIEIDFSPKAGSLVCFLSDQIYHEVLPTKSARLSIAGWFRTNIL